MFDLSSEEIQYCVGQLNGIRPTVSVEEEWESIIANILAGAEFNPMPPTRRQRGSLVALSF